MQPSELQRRIDHEIRELLGPWRAGDAATVEAALVRLGPKRLGFPDFLLGALVVGGFQFALKLAERASPGSGDALLVKVLKPALTRANASPARDLLVAHGLTGVSVEDLQQTLQVALLVLAAEGADLENVVKLALDTDRWEAGIHGLGRMEKLYGASLRRGFWGQKSLCLQKLGRFEEASAAIREGLRRTLASGGSESEALRAIAPLPEPPDEETLLARWGDASEPVVSVVCIVYNHVRYLDDALRGFLGQETTFPFEILIHDDASTDGSQEVIARWHARYPRIIRTFLRTENGKSKGLMPMRNLLPYPRGAFIATCEGDDYWIRRDKLQLQVDFLQANPSFSCSGHNYLVFSEISVAAQVWLPSREQRVITGAQLANLTMLRWMPWTLTMMFRRAHLAVPAERSLAPLGDQFTMSMLGLHGDCMYFEDFIGAVRRENAFSEWTPLSEFEREKRRLRTWMSLIVHHLRAGQQDPVYHLVHRLLNSQLPLAERAQEVTTFLFRLQRLLSDEATASPAPPTRETPPPLTPARGHG